MTITTNRALRRHFVFDRGTPVFLSLMIMLALANAQTDYCRWYAATDKDTYLRASDACVGYFFGGGRKYYSSSFTRFDHASLWQANQPASGAACYFGGGPAVSVTSLYGAAIVNWPCSDAGICNPYPANSAFGCGKTIEQLASSQKSPSDPTRLFHATQACIAASTCDKRCTMDHCKWMDKVLPDFVSPYLAKQEKWKLIESQCRSRGTGWLADRLCAEAMARNHIFNDLLPALIKNGCGSSTDWSTVETAITSCTNRSFTTSVERATSSMVVILYREVIRSQCLARRTAQSLPGFINLDLQGKTCMQQ